MTTNNWSNTGGGYQDFYLRREVGVETFSSRRKKADEKKRETDDHVYILLYVVGRTAPRVLYI